VTIFPRIAQIIADRGEFSFSTAYGLNGAATETHRPYASDEAAKRDRDDLAKVLRAAGHKVRCSTLPSQLREPAAFIAICNDGTARSTPASPVAAATAMDASPAAIPPIRGRDRRKPKLAPEAAARAVAPPGLTVVIRTKTARGMREEMAMLRLGGTPAVYPPVACLDIQC
jgi:hypothetical protein